MEFDHKKWAVWEYRAAIVNNGTNSGSHSYVISVKGGVMAVLLGGTILNGDTSGRNVTIHLRNTDNNPVRILLPGTSVAANGRREFPTTQTSADNSVASIPPDIIIAGTMDMLFQIASLAINENSELSVYFMINGKPPTVALTSPTDAVETETTNVVQ
jgi:hypothetical protein